ncbi:sensor histidine kinase [Longispora albida]|uniref:sensor histidine kinase n=1 Tax=Longispora albida TaxID=203523 RepID=UPI00036704A4|nr:HAMP domain-containing histidine kinase [Longispora albida]
MPLRVRLVAVVLALTGVALLIMGVGTVAALRGHLLGRLDAQLEYIAQQVTKQVDEGKFLIEVSLPVASQGRLHLPNPYVLQVHKPDGSLDTWFPTDLPRTDVPKLTAKELSRTDYFTTQGGWRMVVVDGPNGQRIAIAASMADVDSAVGQLIWLDVMVGLAVLILIGVLGTAVVRSSLRPLAEIEQTAAQIATGQLSRRVPERDSRTELGRLGRGLNGMLVQIEAAFAARAASERRAVQSEDRMRRFVADASHELRTPLTTIRGFAELYRQGAGSAEDVMSRIEAEAARMGLLVEDLLLLARLDQQRPLAMEPVDLLVLVNDSVHAARAQAPDREVTLSAPESAIVVGDEPRLRQVIGNLVSNALTHAPGSPVAVSLRKDGQLAIVEVADQGPGLTREQGERVFERFYRADPARSRRSGQTGTGLGLAIVAALVAAHNGTVEVESQAGHGATFRVRLPLA